MKKNDHGQISQDKSQAAVTEVSGKQTISDQLPVNHTGHDLTKEHRGSQEVATGVNKKPNVSSRRIEANRRNALKSTGPRTPFGKKMVARNAIKHGFFSRGLLISHRDGRENQSEFDDWYGAFREDYQPVGFVEKLWVERIAVLSWRLRRLIRCESGQIALALAEHSYDLKHSKAEDSEKEGSAMSSDPEMDLITDHLLLPSKEDVDKLLRYEAMINKQLNYASAELERLQARRKGKRPRQMSSNIAKQTQEVL